jgi:predicted acyl esterase
VTVYEPAPGSVVSDLDVAVPMRDGVVLRVNLYRPPGPGPFPVIRSAHPYGKDKLPRRRGRRWTFSVQYRIMRQPAPVSFSTLTTWEAPDPGVRPGGLYEHGFTRIWAAATRRTSRLDTDIAAEQRDRPLRDEWWQSRTPDLASIDVPMLVCTSFSDNDLHSRGSFRAFQQASSADRFAYTHRGGKWATFYGADARAAQLAFLDRYLRGADVPAPPRVRLEVRESRDRIVEVRDEQEWPLARTQWTPLYLADHGRLTPDPRIGPVGSASRSGAGPRCSATRCRPTPNSPARWRCASGSTSRGPTTSTWSSGWRRGAAPAT